MTLFYYLLEANTYLICFYAFYKLALQSETFNLFNRYYLIGTSIMSFIMPLILISGLHRPVNTENTTPALVETVRNTEIADIVLNIYLLIAVCLFILLLFRLYRIFSLITKGNIRSEKGIKIVAISDKNSSFSFMKYLFIHPLAEQAETIIRHEQVHIRQWHSADILFFELLQITNWFNPFIRFIYKDIKALHEFIADEETSVYENNAGDYAMFLIRHSYGALQTDLANTMFNQSLLKRRIMKLNQKKSSSRAQLKYIMALLLLPVMLCITSISFAKSYGIIDLMPGERVLIQDTIKKMPPPPPEPPKPKVDPAVFPEPLKKSESEKKNSGNNSEKAPPPPPQPPKPKVDRVVFPKPLKKVESGKNNSGNNSEKAPPPPPEPPKSKVDRAAFPEPVKGA